MVVMPDILDAPNWLQWVATVAILLGLTITFARYFWHLGLSDLWAKRTRKTAKAKAEILIDEFDATLNLKDNERRFHALAVIGISYLILAVLFLGMGAALFYIGLLLWPTSAVPLGATGSSLVFGAFLLMNAGAGVLSKFVEPYTDWDEYFNKTVERVESLLAKAGMSDDEQADFINAAGSALSQRHRGKR